MTRWSTPSWASRTPAVSPVGPALTITTSVRYFTASCMTVSFVGVGWIEWNSEDQGENHGHDAGNCKQTGHVRRAQEDGSGKRLACMGTPQVVGPGPGHGDGEPGPGGRTPPRFQLHPGLP
jgi:hypothetical protein